MNFFSISTYEDIEKLWSNNQIETMNIEFKKEIISDNREISKDISSFANSEGGVIIYGISEDHGRAIASNGILINQNSEKIQQIISSSTSPQIPMTIDVITKPEQSGSTPTHEFVVIKIPKSPFMIHQVTTTSKFYVRNNTITTPHVYESIEMKENEIALRYENRIRSKLIQQSNVGDKEQKIVSQLGWSNYLFYSFIPHVKIPNSIKVTKIIFEDLYKNNSRVEYEQLPTPMQISFNIPSYDGRMTDPQKSTKDFFEMDNDRSSYYCEVINGSVKNDMYQPMFVLGEFIHLMNKFLIRTNSYVGMTFRLKVRGGIKVPEFNEHGFRLEQGNRIVNDIMIEHELPYAPFDLNNHLNLIFEKYFEALHLDNSLQLFQTTITSINNRWIQFDQN
jgi:hypothetical protein